MPILERYIQRKCIEYAQKNGFLCIKVTPAGQRGWPDFVFISPNGNHYYAEFKRPGEAPTKLQQHRMEQLRSRGVPAESYDNILVFKSYVDSLVKNGK